MEGIRQNDIIAIIKIVLQSQIQSIQKNKTKIRLSNWEPMREGELDGENKEP